MKKIGKALLWILGIIIWIDLIETSMCAELEHGSVAFYLILIITGICMALYIWKKSGSEVKELEKENQELKAENQKLRQQLQDQAVRRAMDKAESREREN